MRTPSMRPGGGGARLALACVALILVAAIATSGAGAGGPNVTHFGTPVFVDRDLAGGEPLVLYDPLHGTLVYTAHEGTTHLYRDGITTSPWGNFAFVANYCNQVNVWTSNDGGVNWFRNRYLGTQCPTNPAINTGFSDPDLTMDAGGRIYNTGIDLVNDALFSSADGGLNWDRGTPYCHNGDRPWLAGGKANQVYMGTNTLEGVISHEVFVSNDGGNSCSQTGIPNGGSLPGGGSYDGDGKLLYVPATSGLVEPIVYSRPGESGVGVSTWLPGQAAFTPHLVAPASMYAHWPALTMDGGGVLYLVWDTDDRQTGTVGGCDGSRSPAPNSVMLAYSKDGGNTWSRPLAVARPANARVFWPWVVAGDAGRVSVVWYQTGAGQLADLDCQSADVYIYEAHVTDASSAKAKVQAVNAAGRAIHHGQVCQGGTTCVLTGQDRRLGDFFTNAIDARGCVLIASGDTTLTDPATGGPLTTSRPIFLRQDGGSKLVGKGTC